MTPAGGALARQLKATVTSYRTFKKGALSKQRSQKVIGALSRQRADHRVLHQAVVHIQARARARRHIKQLTVMAFKSGVCRLTDDEVCHPTM
jgi:hypothetical protein